MLDYNNNTTKVRIVRGNSVPASLDNKGTLDLFKSMKPAFSNPMMLDILKDIIYIAIKDICESSRVNDSRLGRFEPVYITSIVTKYVAIYLESGERNVITLLYSVLLDTLLTNQEKMDNSFRSFVNNIYYTVTEILP